MSNGFVISRDGGVLARLRVSPGAKSTELEGAYGVGALRLRVAAPPVGGKAKAEVERFLAGNKAVFVGGLGAARAREAISSRLP